MSRQTDSVLIDIAGSPPDQHAVSFEEIGNSQFHAIGNALYVAAIEEDVPVPSTARAASLASMARKHRQHIFGCVALDDHWLDRRFETVTQRVSEGLPRERDTPREQVEILVQFRFALAFRFRVVYFVVRVQHTGILK